MLEKCSLLNLYQQKKGHYSHLISSTDFCLLLQYLIPFVLCLCFCLLPTLTTFSTSISVVTASIAQASYLSPGL